MLVREKAITPAKSFFLKMASCEQNAKRASKLQLSEQREYNFSY